MNYSWIFYEWIMTLIHELFMNILEFMEFIINSSLHLQQLFMKFLWINYEFYSWNIDEYSRIHGMHEHRDSWMFISATSWMSRVSEKCRFYRFGRQKIEISDINGLLIGPNVWNGINRNIWIIPDPGIPFPFRNILTNTIIVNKYGDRHDGCRRIT
jgi:hypothetical protein